ncbi:MAG: PilC/PilY family type IV pilus protein [Pseudomonadota bacterium]|nr:PilC/PilY family type IV pilus protein [Pseudomonadota bacterium]
MFRRVIMVVGLLTFLSLGATVARASDEDLFMTVTTPDALIILDLSGSMDWNPAGGSNIYGVDTCKPDTTNCCSSGYCSSSKSGCSTNCSRIAIAKRAIFSLLDDDNDGSITSADISSLGIRLGFMRYYNCGSHAISNKPYTDSSACIKLSWGITQADNTTTTPYANIYCNGATCASTVSSCVKTTPARECVAGYGVTGGTPMAYSLREAKNYLDAHKALDNSATCRQKSVIIITDGADTYACDGNGSSTGVKQRRAPVFYSKALADAGYKVYVVGFGDSLNADDRRTLNWMAYYGGTRNPNDTQSAVPSGYVLPTTACGASGSDPKDFDLSGYAFMASDPATLAAALKSALSSIVEANYSFSSQASVAAARIQEENYIFEASFEPRNTVGANKEPFWIGHLKKFALNTDGTLITPHCWDAGAKLRDQPASERNMWTYKGGDSLTAFTTANITAADLGVTTNTRRNEVVGFYRGESGYNLENWKLGDIFHGNPVIVKTPNRYFYDPRQCGATAYAEFAADSNHIRTASNGKQLVLVGANDGQLHAFTTGTSAACESGGEEKWSFIPPNLLQKMAPIAHNDHSDRTTLASHAYFNDGQLEIADVWLPSTAATGVSKDHTEWKTIAIIGQGQGSGNYLWSSSSTCHSTSTSGFSAAYSASYPYYCGYWALDVTVPVTTSVKPGYLWHLGGNSAISSSRGPYLGEPWGKMVTGRVNIAGKERWVGFIGGGYNASSCLSANGVTSYACDTSDGLSPGKGFFVVDLKDGSIIWSFTHGETATATTSPDMDFSLAATPLALDMDNDGFIDTVYVGDLGGNMWRFRLCPRDPVCHACGLDTYYDDAPTGYTQECGTCTTANWAGSLLYRTTATERGAGLSPVSNTHKQIFNTATATTDMSGNLWLYFGTGENNDAAAKPVDTDYTKNRLYGIKDAMFNRYGATSACAADTDKCRGLSCVGGYCYGSPIEGCGVYCPGSARTTADLTNVTSTSTVYVDSSNVSGWYINLSTNALSRSDNTTITNPVGEKMISDPTVFGGVVYFSTYVPAQGEDTACGQAGDAFLYALKFTSGSGAGQGGARTSYIGHGIGSAPVISMRPGGTGVTDIYATASGGAGTSALTQKLGSAPSSASMTNIIYWRDRRVQ